MIDVAARVQHWCGVIWMHAPAIVTTDQVTAALGPIEEDAPQEVVDARIQRAILGLVKARLDVEPAKNRDFRRATGWKVLDQLLAAVRIKELTRVKIVKRGRSSGLRYDAAELAETFYGRQVMEALGFGPRRKVLDRAEYDKLRAEFAKIKLTLPEAIEPTITERFFADED